jgi:hypothetical protein
MDNSILFPVFYMFILTIGVFLLSTLLRFKSVWVDKAVSMEDLHKIPVPESASLIIRQANRNLINLFEFPIFFYIICAAIYLSESSSDYLVSLGYAFFYLRLAHSFYHIFINQTKLFPWRAMFFLPSLAVTFLMWLDFLI